MEQAINHIKKNTHTHTHKKNTHTHTHTLEPADPHTRQSHI